MYNLINEAINRYVYMYFKIHMHYQIYLMQHVILIYVIVHCVQP